MRNPQVWPHVTIVVPTLNSQRTLSLCLDSVVNQKYSGRVDVVIADGGSFDKTLSVARQFKAKIVKNKLKTGEAGKAVGAKFARGEVLAFIDSDNVLPSHNWLEEMIRPFRDSEDVIASEPLYFNYRRQDHWLTRYFALLGMGDPLNLFIGNYDRYSFISDSWTGLKIATKKKGNYLILYLGRNIPTIGANGFLIKKRQLEKYPIKNYLFDIDVLRFLAKNKPIQVAKVKVGIIHLFSGNITTFVRKQKRRIRDFLYFSKVGVRAGEADKLRLFLGVIEFSLATITIFPLLFQVVVGWLRKKDPAWLFHPLACWITLVVYSWESLRFIFVQKEFDRSRWTQ